MVMIKDNVGSDDYDDGDVMIKIDENDPIWQANEAKMKFPKEFP